MKQACTPTAYLAYSLPWQIAADLYRPSRGSGQGEISSGIFI